MGFRWSTVQIRHPDFSFRLPPYPVLDLFLSQIAFFAETTHRFHDRDLICLNLECFLVRNIVNS